MGAASDKSKPRGTMQVATIFTGVAAVTAGMTQAANAQDVAHPAATHTSKHIGRTIRPAGRFDGSIQQSQSCGNRLPVRHPTWLHVSTESVVGGVGYGITSVCFGGAGIYSSPFGVGLYGECGGNNYGYIEGYNNGILADLHFGPGTTYRTISWSHYDSVLITSWKGTDKCGMAPHFG